MNGQERPTAFCDGVDVSPEGQRASAAPASRSWFYREDPRWIDGTRIEACACGGVIVMHLGDPWLEIVGIHNLSTQHREWSDSFRARFQ